MYAKKKNTNEGLIKGLNERMSKKIMTIYKNQSEYEGYFDDIYLSTIKRNPPILKSVLLNFYGVFVCLWQKIVR